MAQTQVVQRKENDQILAWLRKITVGNKDSLEVALSSHTCFYRVVFSLWCFPDFCLFVVQTVKTPIYNFVLWES